LLAPVYGWFTEGFDTADLKAAKALLDELGGTWWRSRRGCGAGGDPGATTLGLWPCPGGAPPRTTV